MCRTAIHGVDKSVRIVVLYNISIPHPKRRNTFFAMLDAEPFTGQAPPSFAKTAGSHGDEYPIYLNTCDMVYSSSDVFLWRRVASSGPSALTFYLFYYFFLKLSPVVITLIPLSLSTDCGWLKSLACSQNPSLLTT